MPVALMQGFYVVPPHLACKYTGTLVISSPSGSPYTCPINPGAGSVQLCDDCTCLNVTVPIICAPGGP